MSQIQQARSAYGATAGPARSPRGLEFDAFARITRLISEADRAGNRGFAALADALHENRRLWMLLAMSVADSANALPQPLRAQIFYLCEFTQSETSRILAGNATAAVLVEVNTAVMRGLRSGTDAQ